MSTVGIDIGGTRVKAAPVDVGTGRLAAEPEACDTPDPATPAGLAAVVAGHVARIGADAYGDGDGAGAGGHGAVGCTFPARLHQGVAVTAVNLDEAWLGQSPAAVFEQATGLPFAVLNDADAAGLAEAAFGAARGVDGLVVLITLGTGVGTALLHHGGLVPNTELGEAEVDGRPVAELASRRAWEESGKDTDEWARSVSRFCDRIVDLVDPALIVVGGGGGEHPELLARVRTSVEVRPAALGNAAGMIGAALAASRL